MAAELEAAKEWSHGRLACRCRPGKGVAAVVQAEAELPLPPPAAFQLMAHPDNAAIFRGIERCTYRQILWASADAGRADGRQIVEVENESDWHFLFIKGSIRTRMLVHEDPSAGTIHVRLAPAGGTAPLAHMDCRWAFAPGAEPSTCRVTLRQEVHPRGLHPLLHNAFRAMAGLQVRKTFEDLYAEALRINGGRPSLAPYASVARKQVVTADGLDGSNDCSSLEAGSCSEAQGGIFTPAASGGASTPCSGTLLAAKQEAVGDPTSVLAAAYEADSSSTTSSSPVASPAGLGRKRGMGSSGAARGSGGAPSSSGSSGKAAGGELRSHPIGSLLDLACLAGDSSDASVAAEAASAAAPATAATKQAATGAGAATAWCARLYRLLRTLWLASDAALGMESNATEQLEEMAVLV